MKLLPKISLSFLLVLLLICIEIGYRLYFVAPYGIIMMNRYTRAELAKTLDNKIAPKDYGLQSEELVVTVEDTIKLVGWYIPSKEESHATVILMHGINSNKEQMLPSAKMLSDDGFNVALFDLRGNGESGGTYFTSGYYEKNDISRIVDYLMSKDSTQSIGIYGNSLGGAIALQTMAKDSRIRCGVVESSFANMREVISDYMTRLEHYGPQFLSNIVLNRAAEIANFRPDSVNPEISAKYINNPVFVAHGDKDSLINCNYSRRIYKNLRSPQKELHIISGAGHATLSAVGSQAYQKSLLSFLHRFLDR